MKNKLNTEKFIEKCKEKYPVSDFDYSKVEYVNSVTPVIIICPKHGKFASTPSSFLNKKHKFGCKKCAYEGRKTNISNTIDFIQKAIAKFGVFYDYDKVDYKGSKIPVEIICPIHGSFKKSPYAHLYGQGCPKCKKEEILQQPTCTNREFINKANIVHNGKYDYSKTKYKRSKQKISIICPIHGEFKQVASTHLQGHGCPKCACEKNGIRCKKNKKWFVEKANKIYDNFYDYSKLIYTGTNNKGIIICPIHGEFVKTLSRHLEGQGCPKCALNHSSIIQSKNINDFVKQAEIVHFKKYDYSKVKYINSHTKICIICNAHGEFWQTPNDHLRGHGCPHCGKETTINKLIKSKESFIRKAKLMHGDKYDYSKVIYKNANTKVSIICPIHGSFLQTPRAHTNGSGCPSCYSRYNQNLLFNKIARAISQVEIIQEFRAKWLGRMSIDIAIPLLNIGIEYDGEQHYKPISIFGGIESFEKQKYRDKIKDELCKTNDFKLFRLKYGYTNEDLDNIINYIKARIEEYGIL